MDNFSIDVKAVFILLPLTFLFLGACYYASFLKREAYLRFSSLKFFEHSSPSWTERAASLPKIFAYGALFFFLAALIDPHAYALRDPEHPPKDAGGEQTPSEGIAIYLLLDNSLSMEEPLTVTSPEGYRKSITKMSLLKEVTKKFVEGDPSFGLKGRPNDLVGIVTFSRSAQVLSPLTLDHATIIKQLDRLQVNKDPNQLGTSLGYAIFKTANLIAATRHFGSEVVEKGKPSYDIKNSVILLVTDGFQETNPGDIPNPLRSMEVDEAVKYAKEQGIRLYIVNIDPAMTSSEYADHRKLFELLTESTGGKFFYTQGSRGLSQIYAEIDQLEKSLLPPSMSDKESMPHLYRRVSFYPLLIAMGMFLLFLSVLLETTWLRVVP